MRALVLIAFLALTVSAQQNPNEKALQTVLWVQHSAEYRALCLQAYGGATRNLELAIALNGGRPVLRDRVMGADGRPVWVERPMAVIMDLDETVIDNSGYQAYLYLNGVSFKPDTWSAWLDYQACEPRAQHAIPGAVDFIRYAESRGVKVFYVSNRPASGRDATADLLEELGVSRPDDGRLLLVDKDADARAASVWGDVERLTKSQGYKERRRIQVQLENHVVAYFGDDLGDFVTYVKTGSDDEAGRLAEVAGNKERWGAQWFILPNPSYGSWLEVLPGDAVDDFGFSKFLDR